MKTVNIEEEVRERYSSQPRQKERLGLSERGV
jgi:hypothetical protein